MDQSQIATLVKLVTNKNSRRAYKAIGLLARQEVELSTIESLRARDEQREFQKCVACAVARGGILGLIEHWDELGSAGWKEALLIDAWYHEAVWLPEFAEVTAHALKDTSLCSDGIEVRWRALGQLNRPNIYENGTLRASTCRKMIPALLEFLDSEDPVRVERAVEVLARVSHKGDTHVTKALDEVLARSGKSTRIEVTTYSGLTEEQRESWEKEVEQLHPDSIQEKAPDEFAESQRRHFGRQLLGEIAYVPTGMIDATLIRKAIDEIAARQPY